MPVLFSHISLFKKLYQYTQPGMVSKLDQERAAAGGFDPSFSTPYLFCRLADSTLEPSLPVELLIAPIRIDAIFIRKNKNMVLEYHKEVANLLANFCCWTIQLIAVDA
jgi:hypothetical protein